MKNISLLLLAALAAISCNDDDNNNAQSNHSDADAVKELVTVSYRDALAASDPEAVTSVFTADGVVMGAGSPTATGASQLASAYSGIFGAVGLDLNFKIDEIILGNNYAFVRSTSAGTATVNATGDSAPEENRELFVLKKVSSDWKIARYIYNKMGILSQAENTLVTQSTGVAGNAQDAAAISQLITTTYADAIASSNAAAVAAAFTSDGVLMAPDSPTAVGSVALNSAYQAVFSAVALNLAFTIDDVVVDGEYGYVQSHSSGTVTVGGQELPASYREIFVVKKVAGQWKIAWYNYNQPQ
jgi:uncharacterized protein (TIGR02246 family)